MESTKFTKKDLLKTQKPFVLHKWFLFFRALMEAASHAVIARHEAISVDIADRINSKFFKN